MKKILLLYPTDLVNDRHVIQAVVDADVVGSVDGSTDGRIVKVIKSRNNEVGKYVSLSEFGSMATTDRI